MKEITTRDFAARWQLPGPLWDVISKLGQLRLGWVKHEFRAGRIVDCRPKADHPRVYLHSACTLSYNTNSKSARSLKYPPHSKALQFVERINAKFFTTHQLSKLLLISKRSPKELDTIEMNNILKFHVQIEGQSMPITTILSCN